MRAPTLAEVSVAVSAPPRERRGRRLAALVASLLGALLAAEVVLRASGVTPYAPRASIANEPQLHAPDPILGWRTVPGSYTLPPYVPGGAAARVTVLDDGSRATGPTPPGARDVLWLVGCSFTFGWAISDDATAAWQLQRLLPGVHVVNRGVNAYGTYQVLLLLEERFARGERPQRVVYGFHEVHEERNVATPRWLRTLDENASRGNVGVPYVTLDATGALQRHDAVRYPAWPLRAQLATVAFLERVFADSSGRERGAEARRVTESLLLAIRDLCKAHGVPFEVVLLQARPAVAKHYARFLRQNGVPVADCIVPIPPEARVPGEGHPNGAVHARWAACMARALGRDA